MSKYLLVAFQGEEMCFRHVLLNALDFSEQGLEVGIILEGKATGLVPAMAEPTHSLHMLYTKAKAAGLIAGVCQACATKMQAVDSAKAEGLRLLNDMSGHPSLARYVREGWVIITF